MLNIAVCDDELAIRMKMEEILNRYPGYPCRVRLFENGRQLLEDTESFDIVFLDVDMPGLDGIQTAGKLRERDKKVKILYLSAYQDYAPSAFLVHAFAYLDVYKRQLPTEPRPQILKSMETTGLEPMTSRTSSERSPS